MELADINYTSNDIDLTPLAVAAGKGRERIARLLLDRGADVNCNGGGEALIVAAQYGEKHMVKLLLDRGTDIILHWLLLHTTGTLKL